MRLTSILFLSGLAAATLLPAAASAAVLITIDKSTQRMSVAVDGQERYVWRVSTGAAEHDTPSGSYTPFRMERDHFSREWDNAPMPNSIFFTGMGHAIHGTGHVAALGRPASHGCVRLSRIDAAQLFALVKAEGMSNTRVVVEGDDAMPSESFGYQAGYDPGLDDVQPRARRGRVSGDAISRSLGYVDDGGESGSLY